MGNQNEACELLPQYDVLRITGDEGLNSRGSLVNLRSPPHLPPSGFISQPRQMTDLWQALCIAQPNAGSMPAPKVLLTTDNSPVADTMC